MSGPKILDIKSGVKRKHDDDEEEIFTNENDDEFLCKIVKVSQSENEDNPEYDVANTVNTPALTDSEGSGVDESTMDEPDESNINADSKAKMLLSETPTSAGCETNEIILEATEDSLIKVDRSTNTEEEYVTDLTKLLRGFQKDYQNLEIDEYKQMLQKFYTQNLRLATRCQKLKAAVEKNQTTTTRILREASKQVNPHQLAFISAQLINNGKSPNKRVWSPQMKNIMVGLFRVSPAAFRFLSKALVLPQEDEINQWIGQGTECDLALEDSTNEDGTSSNISNIEAQAILDEIAFENLMATLL